MGPAMLLTVAALASGSRCVVTSSASAASSRDAPEARPSFAMMFSDSWMAFLKLRSAAFVAFFFDDPGVDDAVLFDV